MGVSNTVQQLSVFLENREGRLEEVLDVLAKSNVNIVALSLADTRRWPGPGTARGGRRHSGTQAGTARSRSSFPG